MLRSRRSSLRTWTCRAALALSAIAPRQVLAQPAPAAVSGAEQQPCPPGVRLVGDEAAAEAVSALLLTAGVQTSGEQHCVTVIAELRREPDGRLGVRLVDTQGRSTDRLVSNAETAAAVIESWARVDLVAPMLEAPAQAVPEMELAPAGQAPSTASKPETHADGVPGGPHAGGVPAGPRKDFDATAWLGVSLADDDSLWTDLSIAGCLRVGAACLGAELRGSFDTEVHDAAAELDTDRGEVGGLLSAEYMVGIPESRWRVSPGFAAGAGYVSSDVDADASPEMGPAVSRGDVSMRLGVFGHVAAAVARDLHLSGRLGFEVAPLARTRAEPEDGVLIPGVPRWYLRFAVGVRYSTF
ncbi:MAG TPA: hypothetical protein VI197_12110 [Polyangiaceae bacterium]